jgi:hypothetical protein
MTARQSFNLLCELQRHRVAAFLRPQSLSKSVPSAGLPITTTAVAVTEGERSAPRSAFTAGTSRKKREARIQIHRTNRREHVASLFWGEL